MGLESIVFGYPGTIRVRYLQTLQLLASETALDVGGVTWARRPLLALWTHFHWEDEGKNKFVRQLNLPPSTNPRGPCYIATTVIQNLIRLDSPRVC